MSEIKLNTNAERQRRARASGRQLRAILRDPQAIARLAELIAEHGSERAAIEAVLRETPNTAI